MGLIDDLRRRLAETLASEAASSASRQAEDAISKAAEDLVGSAERSLQAAQDERAGRAAKLDEAGRAAHQHRVEREQRAADELARLKALKEARDAGPKAGPPDRDL